MSDFEVRSVSVSFSVKMSSRYQSYSFGATREALLYDPSKDKETVKSLFKSTIDDVMSFISELSTKNFTLSACLETHESVGKQHSNRRNDKRDQ